MTLLTMSTYIIVECITGQYATSLYYLLSTTGGVLWVVGGQAMVSGVFWGTVGIDHI